MPYLRCATTWADTETNTNATIIARIIAMVALLETKDPHSRKYISLKLDQFPMFIYITVLPWHDIDLLLLVSSYRCPRYTQLYPFWWLIATWYNVFIWHQYHSVQETNHSIHRQHNLNNAKKNLVFLKPMLVQSERCYSSMTTVVLLD